MQNDKNKTAIATTDVKVLPMEQKTVETVLAKLSEVKNVEKNYLYIKDRIADLNDLNFLDGTTKQKLLLVDSEGHTFETTSFEILTAVKDSLMKKALVIKQAVESQLLSLA